MAAVTICCDFGASPQNKSVTDPIISLSTCHEVMGPDAMILVFWMNKTAISSSFCTVFLTTCSLFWAYIENFLIKLNNFKFVSFSVYIIATVSGMISYKD